MKVNLFLRVAAPLRETTFPRVHIVMNSANFNLARLKNSLCVPRELCGSKFWGLPAVVPSHPFHEQTKADSRWPKLLLPVTIYQSYISEFASKRLDL